ncbi:MAG: hypothetical protein ABIV06_08215 [Thermoanaerobaculia bacterium]
MSCASPALHAPASDAGSAVAALAASALPAASPGRPGQWLFRAEVSGEQGSGSLRLLLRRQDADHFTLSASDALGQARWEVRREADSAIWFDPQARLYCRLDPLRALRARLALPSIPLADLPGLLIGEWPPEGRVGPASPPSPGENRPFTGEMGAESWATWTLWEGGEPAVWFKRVGADSLLSVRRPSVQVRWRLAAHGGLGPVPGSQAPGRSGDADSTASGGSSHLVSGAREMTCPENEIP